jgi:hypothetical protein
VLIAAASDVTITIAGNKIFNNVNGVWLGNAGGATITATGTASNSFVDVENPVVTVS